MNHSAILGICIVLCGTMATHADLIPITAVSGDITNSMFAFTSSTATYAGCTVLEKLEIHIVGDLPYDRKLQYFSGTMLASAGGYIVAKYPNTVGDFANNMSYIQPKGNPLPSKIWATNIASAPQTWLNFAAGNGLPGYSTVEYPGMDNYWYQDNTYNSYTSILGGWCTKYHGRYSTTLDTDISIGTWIPDATLSKIKNTDPDLPVSYDTTLFATLYVKPGTTVTFTGNSAWGGWGSTEGFNFSGTFSIPEPSILALICTGLISLLCYAWRKHR